MCQQAQGGPQQQAQQDIHVGSLQLHGSHLDHVRRIPCMCRRQVWQEMREAAARNKSALMEEVSGSSLEPQQPPERVGPVAVPHAQPARASQSQVCDKGRQAAATVAPAPSPAAAACVAVPPLGTTPTGVPSVKVPAAATAATAAADSPCGPEEAGAAAAGSAAADPWERRRRRLEEDRQRREAELLAFQRAHWQEVQAAAQRNRQQVGAEGRWVQQAGVLCCLVALRQLLQDRGGQQLYCRALVPCRSKHAGKQSPAAASASPLLWPAHDEMPLPVLQVLQQFLQERPHAQQRPRSPPPEPSPAGADALGGPVGEITLAPSAGALGAAAGLDIDDSSSGSRDEGAADACTVEFAAMVLEMQQLYDSNGLVAEASAVSSSAAAAAGGAGDAASMGADTWGAEAAGALTPEASGLDAEEAQVQVRVGCSKGGEPQRLHPLLLLCVKDPVWLCSSPCCSSCSHHRGVCRLQPERLPGCEEALSSTAGKPGIAEKWFSAAGGAGMAIPAHQSTS
jgi:hypothetical protein